MARGRQPQIRYWKRKGGGYFTTRAGEQVELALGPDDAPAGPTYLAAARKFGAMRLLEEGKGTDDYLVSAMIDQYRIHLAATRKSTAPMVFDQLADRFVARHGGMRVSALRPFHLEQYIASVPTWNATTRAHAGRLILCAVAWAKRKGFILTDPLAKCVDLPTPVLRGCEARMPADLMDVLIAEAGAHRLKTRALADLLSVMRATGCRPGELRHAEAHNVAGGRITFRWNTARGYVHKTAGSSQRDRTIYLDGDERGLVERLALEHPEGPIFRTPRGKRWSPTSLSNAWARLLDRPAVASCMAAHGIERRDVKPYNFRHTFISDWMDRVGDIYACAQICGTSVVMITRRYGHPDVERIHEKYRAYCRPDQSSM